MLLENLFPVHRVHSASKQVLSFQFVRAVEQECITTRRGRLLASHAGAQLSQRPGLQSALVLVRTLFLFLVFNLKIGLTH